MAETPWLGVRVLELESAFLLSDTQLDEFADEVEFAKMVVEQLYKIAQEARPRPSDQEQ
jgi:hypothetical protein